MNKSKHKKSPFRGFSYWEFQNWMLREAQNKKSRDRDMSPGSGFFNLVFTVIVNEACRVNILICACGGMLLNRKQCLVREATAAYFQRMDEIKKWTFESAFLFPSECRKKALLTRRSGRRLG